MPGSPLDPRAEGTNSLIKQGATPVTEAADIIAVLRPIMGLELPAREPEEEEMAAVGNIEPAPDERTRIVALLSPTAVSIDDLIRLSKSSPRIVRMVLLELEIAGRLERHGGGMVSLLQTRRSTLFLGSLVCFEPRHFQNITQRIEAVASREYGKLLYQRCDVLRRTIGGFVPIRLVLIVAV